MQLQAQLPPFDTRRLSYDLSHYFGLRHAGEITEKIYRILQGFSALVGNPKR